ncbi:MAG: hypothetical protein HPY84_01415 [Syntrophobacteraceae bacterium]|nr:hypothetical protein [Syntrophobacteraceae bacterium]
MNTSGIQKPMPILVVCFLACAFWSVSTASAGALRITMRDGTSVEVPYYWELHGEIKFDVPGGVAGVPRDQISSIQEVLESREFDPDTLFRAPLEESNQDPFTILREAIEAKISLPGNQRIDPRQDHPLIRKSTERKEKPSRQGTLVRGEQFVIEKNLPAVCVEREGTQVIMQNLLSSRVDLKNRSFILRLFDAEGNVLQQKTCELHELDVDQAALKKLNIRGSLYIVKAEVKPDPRIKRYEITAESPGLD